MSERIAAAAEPGIATAGNQSITSDGVPVPDRAIHPEIDGALERKVKLLVDEFVRIRNYENQLRARAQVLDAVLDSTLDFDATPASLGEGFDSGKEGEEELGMGGGDFSSSPLFSSYPTLHNQEPIEDLDSNIAALRSTLHALEIQADVLSQIPLGTPVIGKVASRYGTRKSPFTGERQKHHGYDISVTRKSVVRATADGIVISAGTKGAYGKTIVIDHGGNIETLYGHLSRVSVKAGQSVCRGQAIGLVGSTGRSTGPHVHYEVRVGGTPRDPEPFVQLAGVLKTVQ
jgi:murein DD-endopeptidase MepM/ murein hydrolase activator NlpD